MVYPIGSSDVERFSGPDQQLVPTEEQIVDGEPQVRSRPPAPLIEVAEPDRRMAPLPTTAFPGAAIGIAAGVAAPVFVSGQPVLVLNRYTGNSNEWQELVRWDILPGLIGDLHEISLLSTSDADTRYQVIIGNVDMLVPLDRATSTPFTAPWRDTKIPGTTSVLIRVRSETGVAITVDGIITGTLRTA